MKTRALITSIAALFLATGAAHAVEFNCGADTTVYVQKETLHITHKPGEEATVNIKVQIGYGAGKRYPIVQYDIQKEKLMVNGRLCKENK
jgi:hypothetical protein